MAAATRSGGGAAEVDAKAMGGEYSEMLKKPMEEFKLLLPAGEYRDMQQLCKFIGISAQGSRAELDRRVLEYKQKLDVGEVDAPRSPEGREGRARSPRHGVAAAASRSVAPQVSASVAASEAAAASRAAAASLMPGALPPATPGPSQPTHVGAAIPPPASSPHADMAVDSDAEEEPVPQQQPVAPQMPQHPQPIHLSPVVARHKAKFQELFARNRAPLPPLEAIPALPTDSTSAEVLQTLANGMNTLITGVNELRVSCADTVKVKDLEAFREIQSEEFREMVTVHTEPIKAEVAEVKVDVVHHDARITKLEAQVKELQGGGEKARKRALDENDPAFKQIAFVGFKLADLEQRAAMARTFVEAHAKDAKITNVETIMNGPWKQRKPTGVLVVEFASRDVRDRALKAVDGKEFKDGNEALKIQRARTRAQRARNWALRKAEELAKIEAQRRGVSGAARIDFMMPTRKVFIGEELAFVQQKDELRGQFVDVFAGCVLPP